MAKEPSTPAEKLEKLIDVEVVTNYGGKLPGAKIQVTEREYGKFKKPDGKGWFTFPVLISPADKAEDERRKKAVERKDLETRAARDDRSRSEGWAEYQRRSLDQVRAQRAAEQRRVADQLAGAATPPQSAEDIEARYRERVAAARTG